MIHEHLFAIVPIEHPPHTCVQTFQISLVIQHELLGRYTILSGVRPKVSSNLGVTIISPEDPWPLRPWVIRRAAGGRLGQELEVRDGLGPMSHGGTDTVVPSVTTSDNDNILALRADVVSVLELGIQQRLGIALQELHSEVDAVSVTVW